MDQLERDTHPPLNLNPSLDWFETVIPHACYLSDVPQSFSAQAFVVPFHIVSENINWTEEESVRKVRRSAV
jgi:hypothetical protein